MGLLGTASYFIYQAGVDNERAANAKRIAEAGKKDDEKVKTVIEFREKIKVIYRDRIKKIKSVEDPTGCADIKYTDMGFGLHMRPDSN